MMLIPKTKQLFVNIYEVRDAYYADLESGYYREGEDVVGFLNRHCIEWAAQTNIL